MLSITLERRDATLHARTNRKAGRQEGFLGLGRRDTQLEARGEPLGKRSALPLVFTTRKQRDPALYARTNSGIPRRTGIHSNMMERSHES